MRMRILCFGKRSSRRFLLASCLGAAVLCGTLVGAKLIGQSPVPDAQFKQFISGVRLGAHRGLAEDGPENTIEAFIVSKRLRVDSVEFDIAFTKDGRAILMHDNTVDRTTNGSGKVAHMTFEDVRLLNAAAKFNGSGYTFAQVPTLEEAVEFCLENNLKIFFDIKAYQRELGPTFARLFETYKRLYTMGAVCSFDPRVPFAIKKADPNIIVGLTWRPYFLSYDDVTAKNPRHTSAFRHSMARAYEETHIWSLHHWLYKTAGIQLVLAHYSVVNEDYVKMWRERGIEVVVWTVNDFEQRRYFYKQLKVPLITDKLSDFQDEIER